MLNYHRVPVQISLGDDFTQPRRVRTQYTMYMIGSSLLPSYLLSSGIQLTCTLKWGCQKHYITTVRFMDQHNHRIDVLLVSPCRMHCNFLWMTPAQGKVCPWKMWKSGKKKDCFFFSGYVDDVEVQGFLCPGISWDIQGFRGFGEMKSNDENRILNQRMAHLDAHGRSFLTKSHTDFWHRTL